MTKTFNRAILPIMFSFFVMGFVDVVNISTSHVKEDFHLSDTVSNLLPMMVFLWFAIFSLPTGILMGHIGRKRTVLLSAVITTIAMLIPLFYYDYVAVLIAFALLGIGNTILQVSLNPLLTNVVPQNQVTSMLTLGQFIKAICSFLGPVIVGVAATYLGNWKLVFPIYALVTIISFVWLLLIPVKEEQKEMHSSLGEVLSLLKNKYILLLFSVIVLIVGFEVGLMTAVPKFLLEKCSLPINEGGYSCSLYYISRTVGTFAGAFLLARINSKQFFVVAMFFAVAAFFVILISGNTWVINIALSIVGLACANVFAIIFSEAMQSDTEQTNEISALMIMGVAGGALIPPLMGRISDASNQWVSLFIPLACLIYILVAALYIRKVK